MSDIYMYYSITLYFLAVFFSAPRDSRRGERLERRRIGQLAEGQRANFDLGAQESTRQPGIDSHSGIDLI